MNEPSNLERLRNFADGVAKQMEDAEVSLATSLSDCELASIAWPEGPPEGCGETWSNLSPKACDTAIGQKLKSQPTKDELRTD